MKKRFLVGSGGGDKGALAVGKYKCLHDFHNRTYDGYIGTSTCAMIQTLAVTGQWDRLYDAYTTTEKSDVIEKGIFNKLKDFILGNENSETLGNSYPLEVRIKQYFTQPDYIKAVNRYAFVEAVVTNGTTGNTEYKDVAENSYEDYCDWILASGSVVPFMSQVHKDGMIYADGGFSEHAPIQRAIDLGADEIDAIILRPKEFEVDPETNWDNVFRRRTFKTALHWINVAMYNLNKADIKGLKSTHKKPVTINFYYSEPKYGHNSLSFDKEDMKSDFSNGYRDMKTERGKETIIIK